MLKGLLEKIKILLRTASSRLRLNKVQGVHPLQNIFDKSPAEFNRRFRSCGGSSFDLLMRKVDNEKTIKIRAKTPSFEYRDFQQLYFYPRDQFVKNITFESENQIEIMRFNNLGTMGDPVQAGDKVNLFVGASETFAFSVTGNVFSASGERLPNVIDAIKIKEKLPGKNINGSIEGASFLEIVSRVKNLISSIENLDASISNVFVFAGWHNLIYNNNSELFWEECVDTIRSLHPKCCH